MQRHHYGPAVHLLGDRYLLSLLARIGAPETGTAELPALVRSAYTLLCQHVLAARVPAERRRVPTRMTAGEPRAWYDGPLLSSATRLVICAVIRAGLLPAQTCYELAVEVLPPENVRLDYLNMSRVVDDAGHVAGVRLDGSKVGGPIDGCVVLIPDPMAATGSTLASVRQAYRELSSGTPQAIAGLHLMVTPEALARLRDEAPDVEVWAGRVDRGLSPPDVLAADPGAHWDRERGLDDAQYIVPGAGGMGELLSNSWV